MAVTGELGDVFAALYAAHTVADHWLQTPRQASRKGLPGMEGRAACLRHVAVVTVACGVSLTLCRIVTGDQFGPWTGAALLLNMASHYLADRRAPLAALAGWCGKTAFWQLGQPREGRDDNPVLGTGAYALDQAWHAGWLLGTALLITAGAR